MKKLFIHHPFFRLLSPLFSGTLVYLLILLINNNIVQLQESFLGQELYVCIGLAYIIQEYSRFSLLIFERIDRPKSFLLKIVVQVLSSVFVGILLVTLSMYFYFKYVLFYTPNFRELFIFNSLFSFITLLYVILYLSHLFLYKVNTEKISREVLAKSAIQEDFLQFKRGINPELLFESLEAILVLMKESPDGAEQFSDYFASVYRYILSKRDKELVSISEELVVLNDLIYLFNHLPYRKVQLGRVEVGEIWVLPTSLLTLVEGIIRTTIASERQLLVIDIIETDHSIKIQYRPEEKIQKELTVDTIQDLIKSYTYYAVKSIRIYKSDEFKVIELPKLNYHESGHN